MQRESAAVRVLQVSRDIHTIEFLCQQMQQLSIHVETACDVDSALSKLCHSKFEGVIVDFDLGDGALQLLKKLRDLTSHRHAISFGIVQNEVEAGEAFRAHANFVLNRPLAAPSVVRMLRASYPMMFRERRRDYRYPIEMRTMVRVDNSEVPASSINISETGMAVHLPTPLSVGTNIHLRLDLPGMAESLSLSGEVRWNDPKGRTGIHFLEIPAALSERLQLWLSERMTALVPRC